MMFSLLLLAIIILGVKGFCFSFLKCAERKSNLWGATNESNFEKLFSKLEGIQENQKEELSVCILKINI